MLVKPGVMVASRPQTLRRFPFELRAQGWRFRSLAAAGMIVAGLLSCMFVLPWIIAAHRTAVWKLQYRAPVEIPFPPENPFTAEKAKLGKELFYDPRMSRSGTMACANCHQAQLGWSDGRSVAIGDSKESMTRRSPTLIDLAWVPIFGWDGKFPNLEAVAFGAITGPFNMNLSEAEALERIEADPKYRSAFARIFPDGVVTERNVASAIATFERLIISIPNAPFDRWIAGDEGAISPAAKRGFSLFNGPANCAACHSGWAFTDGSFHDIGGVEDGDPGRGQYFPTSVVLRHAFKTPTLRGVAERGPFLHNGSVVTLEDVIDLYDRGGFPRRSADPLIHPLHLSAREKQDLLEFLKTLSGPVSSTVPSPLPPEKTVSGPRQGRPEQDQAAK